MPTIINNPSGATEDVGSNLVLGIILILVTLGGITLFFMYGLPMIENNRNPDSTNINVVLPSTTPPPNTTPPAQK